MLFEMAGLGVLIPALGLMLNTNSSNDYPALQPLLNILGKKIYLLGARYAYVKIKGFGNSRYSSIKGLSIAGLKILNIIDLTPFPFNGCRNSKKRRI